MIFIPDFGSSVLDRFRPAGRGTFLCAAKEKYPKETRPGGLPAGAGSLRFSGKPALAQTAISLALDSPRHGLACPGFPCDARLRLQEGEDNPSL
jgi:hypothetical protein